MDLPRVRFTADRCSVDSTDYCLGCSVDSIDHCLGCSGILDFSHMIVHNTGCFTGIIRLALVWSFLQFHNIPSY